MNIRSKKLKALETFAVSFIIKQGVALGDNCLVGMGLAIRHNYPDNSKILSNQKI